VHLDVLLRIGIGEVSDGDFARGRVAAFADGEELAAKVADAGEFPPVAEEQADRFPIEPARPNENSE
jgi:hypothetical protein